MQEKKHQACSTTKLEPSVRRYFPMVHVFPWCISLCFVELAIVQLCQTNCWCNIVLEIAILYFQYLSTYARVVVLFIMEHDWSWSSRIREAYEVCVRNCFCIRDVLVEIILISLHTLKSVSGILCWLIIDYMISKKPKQPLLPTKLSFASLFHALELWYFCHTKNML